MYTHTLLVLFHKEIPGDEVSGRRNRWIFISHIELATHKHENLNQKLQRKKIEGKSHTNTFYKIFSFLHLWPLKAENQSSKSFWSWLSMWMNMSQWVGSGEACSRIHGSKPLMHRPEALKAGSPQFYIRMNRGLWPEHSCAIVLNHSCWEILDLSRTLIDAHPILLYFYIFFTKYLQAVYNNLCMKP